MHKFFVNENQIQDDVIRITGKDVNHIINVLRLEIGQEVLIGNRDNVKTYIGKIREKNKEDVLIKIIEEKEQTTEPNTYIHLFQGLPKSDKMELIVQKCTEIGVSEITPVIMNRCIVKIDEKENKKKNERWQKIAEAAAEQSKRDFIPKINFAKNLKNIFKNFGEYDIVLIAYENEQEISLKQILHGCNKKLKRIAIIVGPEGGIEQKEIDEIVENGGQCISLGKRILRTETAPIVMSALILYELNDMGEN